MFLKKNEVEINDFLQYERCDLFSTIATVSRAYAFISFFYSYFNNPSKSSTNP